MKNNLYTYFASFTILFILSVQSYAQMGWQEVTPIPSTANINSISVVDENTIWVAGDNASLYRSTDAGNTWQYKNTGIPSTNFYGISATDVDHCWVGTQTGRIYRTANGGLSWGLQVSITGSFINGVHMFDNNNGVFTADPTGNGVPFQNRFTTDGGANWMLAPNSPIANNEYGVVNAWDWTNQYHIWIGVANITSNATSSKIMYTQNGFNGTWFSSVISGTGNSQGLYFQAVGMTDTLNGLAGTNQANIVKTTDGGVNWSTVTPPSGISIFSIVNINALKDGSNLIRAVFNSIDFGSKIYTTTDLGTNWIEEVIPPHASTLGLQHLQFISASRGYAGGKSGLVMKYTGPNVPVELSSFSGVIVNNDVKLIWTTETELNNNGFEIERSINGKDFITRGFIKGNGTSTEQKKYSFKDITPLSAKYTYRLKQIDFNGSFEYSSTINIEVNAPIKFSLEQNFPNPFNPSTNIKFTLPEKTNVVLKIYNVLGTEIITLLNEIKEAGSYETNFNAGELSLSSGIYFYSISAGSFSEIRKMMLIK